MICGRVTGERGVSLVELAIFLPLLTLILGGMIGFGSFFNDVQLVSDAVKFGAREASRQSALSCTNIDIIAITETQNYLVNANRPALGQNVSAEVLPTITDIIIEPDDDVVPYDTHAIRVSLTLQSDVGIFRQFQNLFGLEDVEAFTVQKLEGACTP